MNNIIDYIKYFDYKKLIFPTTIIILYVILFLYFEDKINNIEIPIQEPIYIEKEEPQIEQVEPIKYIYIDIKGAVKKPGVYKLQENSRIIDAINIAGGLLKTANTSYTNLSKILNDSDVIKIYTNDEIKKLEKETPEELPKIETNITEEPKQENSLININTSTKEQLQTLNGIGESKANSIIDYRTQNGPFKTIEDIKNVSGISETLYDKIKDFITV